MGINVDNGNLSTFYFVYNWTVRNFIDSFEDWKVEDMRKQEPPLRTPFPVLDDGNIQISYNPLNISLLSLKINAGLINNISSLQIEIILNISAKYIKDQ
jgi:hypothetical protein